MLFLIVVWALALCVVYLAVRGPRWWFGKVTSHIDPGRREPNLDGYVLLARRNRVVALLVVGIALWLTFDDSRLSQEDFEHAVVPAVAALDGESGLLNGADLELAVEDRLDQDVVALTISSEALSSRQEESGYDLPVFYEVFPASEPDIEEPTTSEGEESEPVDLLEDPRAKGVQVDDKASEQSAADDFGRGEGPVVCVTISEVTTSIPIEYVYADVSVERGLCEDSERWQAALAG